MVGLPTRRMDDSCRWDNSGISEKSIFFDFISLTFFTLARRALMIRVVSSSSLLLIVIRYEQHSAQAAFG
jgi:hypothetical protein